MLQCEGVKLILPDAVAGGVREAVASPTEEKLPSPTMTYVWNCLKTALKKKRKTEGSIHPSSCVFKYLYSKLRENQTL